MNRLHTLDYLRGIAALGILIFHFMKWGGAELTTASFIERIGFFGVSVFYILSGLTLHYVYYDRLEFSRESLFHFYKKRIFRIFPLLWLITILSIIISKKSPNLFDLFLNLSGLFGFVKWDTYFSPGVWSIGNELVFYVFFPLFVFCMKFKKWLMFLLSLLIIFFMIYFSFFAIDVKIDLGEQWKTYINPLNQVYFFLGGFLMGYLFRGVKLKRIYSSLLIVLGLLIMICFPVGEERISLVFGINRVVFSLACFLICLGTYSWNNIFSIPNIIHRPFSLLGEASYSVYLLHPLVYQIVSKMVAINNRYFYEVSSSIKLFIALSITLVLSYLVYEYFEKYFMKLARKV